MVLRARLTSRPWNLAFAPMSGMRSIFLTASTPSRNSTRSRIRTEYHGADHSEPSGLRLDHGQHEVMWNRELDCTGGSRPARREVPVWSKISNALKRLVSGLIISSHSCFLKPQQPVQSGFDDQLWGGSGMIWARMLAYITGTVDQELLLRNEYLAAENRILRAQIKGRLLLSEADKATLAEIAHRLGAFDNLTWPTCAPLIWPTLR